MVPGHALRICLVLAFVIVLPAPVQAADPARDTYEGPDVTTGESPPPEGSFSADSLKEWDRLKDVIATSGALSAHVDPDDGDVVVWIPRSGSSRFSAGDVAFVGRPVRLQESPLEPEDIPAIREAVESVAWKPLRAGVAYPSAAFDSDRGVMEILSDAPVEVFEDILKSYEGKVIYSKESLVLSAGDRCNDVSPHYGGAGLDWPMYGSCASPPQCTSAFSVLNYQDEPRMMTAAHCLLDGGVNNAVWSQDGTSFGYAAGYSHYHTVDAGLIGDNGIDHGPYIYVGGVYSSLKKGVRGGSTASGSLTDYCFGGTLSGEHCGMTLDTANDPYHFTISLLSGETYTLWWMQLFTANVAGNGACPGDSGAPFYRYSNFYGNPGVSHVWIYGLITAGGNEENCGSNRKVVVTRYGRIVNYGPTFTLQLSPT